MILAKYGTELTFHAPMIKAGAVDHATNSDWTPLAGDVKVSKDEGTQANIGTLPAYTNGEWVWTLSATEMQAEKVYVKAVDSATKAVEDQAFMVLTYGNASAHIVSDLDSLNTTTPPTAVAIRSEIDSNSTQLAAIVADTNELQSDDVPGLIAALNNVSAADILTTALTEAYAADGSQPTLTQAVYLILQHLGESSISGTTKTVKQLDGSTTAATFTLDDASSPTSITRAT